MSTALSLPIIELTYSAYKEIFLLTNALPKKAKYTLGQSIGNTTLKILENLIFAKNASATMKTTYLLKVHVDMEILTFKLRLLLELNLINETKIFQIQSKLQEAGRMLGGWIKSLQS